MPFPKIHFPLVLKALNVPLSKRIKKGILISGDKRSPPINKRAKMKKIILSNKGKVIEPILGIGKFGYLFFFYSTFYHYFPLILFVSCFGCKLAL